MANDKQDKSTSDKSQVPPEENYELYYLEEKLGVTRDEILAAIKTVGRDRHLVEGYLRTHKKDD
ncbi:DUF3606 domain-containing protein [Paraflavitalea sp. CAU 1676]|uniref:DUF3606 domain-containing protein n=1 Tax=Paraflavitalea sp. CAU 1676 TaxID=3032598 RepID=UPI0023D9BE2D|nr:DUF3606 domain-containing protein [Paraflavitalea sp. CAU 1676]MDF2191277.1 DUF3606 domain-containing protein [Paraflavitalea sp. CAU 1676]